MGRKLSAMGLFAGTVVRVMSTQGGPLLLGIGDNRLAMGRGLAQRIMVRPCNGADGAP